VTTVRARFRLWSQDPYFDPMTREELLAIAADSGEIEDRFYRTLEFGTGGLRGIIGAGTNRMNRYVVRQATRGLADYISSFGEAARSRGVVIAHDCRRLSPEFALQAALTLNASGIVAYLWDSLRPTPLLSYAVRELGAIAGIVVTASHNPKEYNGFKVYWEDGGQVPPERAQAILERIASIEDITDIQPMAQTEARERRLLRAVAAGVDRSYVDRLVAMAATPPQQRSACRILYTPLHGSGNIPVRQALTAAGFEVSVVREQEQPDSEFSTVPTPNPENPAVFDLALGQAQAAAEKPDVIMATDPDADRLGVLARDRDGRYRHLTGNQIGAVLVEYLLCSRRLPQGGAVIKTIATSNLIAPLCREHGVALMDTHTGFKFIGEKINEFAESGAHEFIFGFEESYGYLGATFVRDKDAVMAALLMADATAYHKAQGRTLYDALERIWQRCGCFQEGLYDVKLPGQEGQARIAALMDTLRREPPGAFASVPIAFTDDYATGVGVAHASGAAYPLALGRANVLHYRFEDGGFVMVRPSGTEPKLKVYFSVTGTGPDDAQRRLAEVQASALAQMGLG